ncbi:MAG: restriction endonuclease subunit S [Clostridium sp.]|uniref:restriction endonuclease subunit S n=1 Tax=Cetobacterium sp. TaxID=2071632 RepID=UPI003F406093
MEKLKNTILGKIPLGWSVENLEDNLEKIIDYRGKTPTKAESGVITLSAKSVKMNYIDYSNAYYVSKETYDKFMVRGFPKKGDILMTTEAPLGCIAELNKEDVCVAQRLLTLRGKKEKLLNKYLMYYLQSNIGQHELLSKASGTTVQGIKRTEFSKVNIILPPLETQEKIASILSALDDKIEINNEMNKTLEEMAQIFFKRWFIDFDFPNENGEPYRSSGGKMVDSELGEIPEGWEVKELDEITEKFATGLNPRKNFVLGEGENFYVTIKNMNNNNVILDDKCDKVTLDALQKINKRSNLKIGDILFSGIGTIGKVFYIDKEPMNWNISESIFTIRANSFITSEFLYLLALSKPFQEYSLSLASGSVQKGIRMGDLKRYKNSLPKIEVILKFSESISKILGNIKNNIEEIKSLTEIRDTLLPKLMSGEVKI